MLMSMLATYIHQLNPEIFSIPDTPLALRWYGLAYVAGFLLGYYILRYLSSRDLYVMPKEKLGDFITWIGVLGVVAGGRFGEFFFYWLPREGWSGFANDPLWVLRVWEGGMASHGGIIGVCLVCLYYSRRYKLPLLPLGDGLAIVAPIGLCFGRLANFINGELYGRVASADNPLAMQFPRELHEISQTNLAAWHEMYQRVLQVPTLAPPADAITIPRVNEWLIEQSRESETLRDILSDYLTPRYPSQLFEAFSEGLIIFLVLITLRLVWKKAPAGIFCAIFFFMYAVGRIVSEYYREPENDLWMGFTRGQYLSFGVIGLGVFFLYLTWRNQRKSMS